MKNNYLKIYTILINFNGIKDTIECLISLSKVTFQNLRVIIVDNNSNESDKEKLRSLDFPFIDKIIFSDSNLGFSGGNNLGIKYTLENGADYILLLNNDTVVQPEFLNQLLLCFEKDEKIGISTCQINYYYDKNKVWYGGGYIDKLRASGYSFTNADTQEGFVTFASGCCLLIKKNVIEDIGLLDENYFLYLEDTDYCARVIKKYKIFFSNKTLIYHKVGASVKSQININSIYYSIRNRLFFQKKMNPQFFLISYIYIVLTHFIKAFYKGRIDLYFKTIFNALRDFHSSVMGKKLTND